jgi:hypothetical protein
MIWRNPSKKNIKEYHHSHRIKKEISQIIPFVNAIEKIAFKKSIILDIFNLNTRYKV